MLPVIFLNLTVLSLLVMETHSPNITTKNNIKGVGNFSVKYFKEDDLQDEINRA